MTCLPWQVLNLYGHMTASKFPLSQHHRTCGAQDSLFAIDEKRTASASSVRIIRRVFRCLRALLVIFHMPGHVKLNAVMTRPEIATLVRRRPIILFKYLHVNYLLYDLSRTQKLAAMTFHYEKMTDCMQASFLRRFVNHGITIWNKSIDGHQCEIALSFPSGGHDFEGELRLEFVLNNSPLYFILLTFIDGKILNVPSGTAVLITTIQGIANKYPEIRNITKLFNDTAPAHLLTAAAAGVGFSFGASMLLGAGNKRQLSLNEGPTERFLFDYDKFWEGFEGASSASGIYVLPLPFPEKPLHLMQRNRRARTVRKRELKRAIAQEVFQNLSWQRIDPA